MHMSLASCLAFTAQTHYCLLCFLMLVLSLGFSWGLLRRSAMAYAVPLKLGLIRASYPDVFPMSLSRKSEGESSCLLGCFISSLQELSLTLPRRRGKDGNNKYKEKEKREDMKNGSEGVHACLRGSSGGCGQRKKINEASKSVISTKHSSRCEMRVKNDNWMACLSWQLKAYLFPIMTKTYWSC